LPRKKQNCSKADWHTLFQKVLPNKPLRDNPLPMKIGKNFSKTKTRDFRLFLQSELVRRCEANEKYSLRAYARSLRIAPSALSAILNGKRPVTHKMKLRLGLSLGLSPQDLGHFQESKTQGHTLKFQQLALDTYAVISDWYHYAILELTHLKNFRTDPKWIAKSLGITTSEVNIAVERLQRVGLLKIENDSWLDTTPDGHATNIQGDLTSAASRKLQRQILEKSIRALDDIPIAKRDHTSMTMAINPEDLPEAKEKITRFRRELCAFFEKRGRPTQVYQLAVSLYPVTQIDEGEKNEQ
jgi:plasmid maintenance system antidote protein VapI